VRVGDSVKSVAPAARSGSRDEAILQRLTAIVLNWEMPDLTARCVRSLLADGVPAERIVIVDNGSKDGSSDRFEREFADCLLVKLPENVGIARGINAGAKALDGDDYLILNNDAFAHAPGTVVRLVEALRRKDVGIAVPRLLNEDLTLQPNVVPLFKFSPFGAFVAATGIARLLPKPWRSILGAYWDHSASSNVVASSGAVYAVRAAAWQDLGGMSERRWMYCEDIDLCWRARERGWKIWFEHEATFVHLGSPTLSRHWKDATRAEMIARSEAAMVREHLSPNRARVTMLFLGLGSALRSVVFALARRPRATAERGAARGYVGEIWARDGDGRRAYDAQRP
jgi:GT2 family glycosyltransferase